MPDAPPVRFGVVGCGSIGATADDRARRWPVARWWLPLSHASAIAATDGAELAAVCDVDEAAARQAMQRYRLPTYYLDHRRMLADEPLQAITIATRTPDRGAIIDAGLQHRVQAIYCEKPLSNTLEEADRLAARLTERGVFFLYGTRRRFMPAYAQVRERLRAGALGALRTIVVRFGRGPLLWNHPHSVDIAAFFAGDAEVEWVQADLDLDPACVQGAVIDADPILRMGCIRFANGVTAHLVDSDSCDVELSGTEGLACIRNDGSSVQWRSRAPGDQQEGWLFAERVEPADHASTGTVNSMAALAQAVRTGRPPGYDVRLAVRNQEILFGFVWSHLQGGGKVRFPIERRGLTITGRLNGRVA